VFDNKIPEHTIASAEKALSYGLPTSAYKWQAHLSDNLRSMGFKPTRFDPEVCLRLGGDKAGYDYMGTHTKDLMVAAKEASHYMSIIREKYIVEGSRLPRFHLGCNYQQSDDNK
jgi:hypothetical protein